MPAAAPRAAKPAHGKAGKNDPGWRPSMYPARPAGSRRASAESQVRGARPAIAAADRERGRDPHRAPRPGKGHHADDQQRGSDAVEDVDPQEVPRRAEAAGGEHPEPEEERVAEDLEAPRKTRLQHGARRLAAAMFRLRRPGPGRPRR